MTARGATLLTTSLLAVGLGLGSANLSVPYVALGPGPVTNTLGETADGAPLIEVSGRRTYPTKGRLDLTTVNVYSELHLGDALQFWFDDSLAVVPREVIYPEDQTPEETEQQNQQEMAESQEHAVVAALRELKVPVLTTVTIDKVTPDGPAARAGLRSGDVVVSADGQPVDSLDALREVITSREAGRSVRLGLRRDGTPLTVVTGTRAAPDDGRATVGVTLSEKRDYPFKVTIQLKDVGGPSAGLMFALGIIDLLTPGELTGGKHVAGTGTIDDEGNVGPIGGIQQKLVGAREAGASDFLVPAGNWEEATGAEPSSLKLHRVATLTEALAVLRSLGGV